MSTITSRSVTRGNPNRARAPQAAEFVKFLNSRKVEFSHVGRLKGSRVLYSVVPIGPFIAATFIHPTKRPAPGRMVTMTWRKPPKQEPKLL